MKFLFINGKFPQYSQTFVHDQIKMVKSQGGNEVEVYARGLANFRFQNSVPECASQLLYGKPFNKKLLFRVILNTLKEPLRAIKALRLYKQGKINYSTLMLILQLKRKPEVIVTHFGNNFKNGMQLKQFFFPDAKNVIVFHGHDVSSYVKKYGWGPYRNASPYVDAAISVNKLWAEQLAANTTIKDIRTIHLGTERFDYQRRINGDSAFSILFVGRFVEKKGFDLLFEAVKKLRVELRQKFRVHCVGDGPDLEFYKKKASALGLERTFIFYGAKQKKFAIQLMQECHLLIAPSRRARNGDSEGLPVVLMEAMMVGIPVLSTYHSGIPEIITHMDTGLLVPENDVIELEKMIAFAVKNPGALEGISEKARAHVEKFHDQEVQVKKFTTALEDIA